MAYGTRRSGPSILDSLSLSPLPYPVLLILAVASVFFFISWYFSYEEAIEAAEEKLNLVLLAIPLVLIVLVRWLSSVENPAGMFFGLSPWEQRRRTYWRAAEDGGSSPWGVAAFIVLVLILVWHQSNFLDKWFF